MKSYEVEQKYRIQNPGDIRRKLKSLKARKISSGVESDEFYDEKNRLYQQRSILRLRQTAEGKGLLTFKGPRLKSRFKKRVEIQTAVDHKAAQVILQLAGFECRARLQKRREEYRLGSAHVTLDHLRGIGWFVEIEAAARQIPLIAKKLSLKSREDRSYLQMYLKKYKD